MESTQPAVVDNTAAGQFEIRVDGQLALLVYSISGNVMRLIHTEVPPGLQGRGYANRLARAALEHAKREKLLVEPRCSFVHAYLERHPEYAPLVAAGE
jgi:uncharacterized protein